MARYSLESKIAFQKRISNSGVHLFSQPSILFDTSVATENIGDEIIMDAVRKELAETIPAEFLVRLPTHDSLGRVGRKWIRKSKIGFVGGTNLLSAHHFRKWHQWHFSMIDAFLAQNKMVLVGTGWWQYQTEKPDYLTRVFYKTILSKGPSIHSVRDSYTEAKLREIGIKNIINTSCPTMWKLTNSHCQSIPKKNGHRVVVTLTDYNKSPELDQFMLKCLRDLYSDVLIWPQGAGDLEYLRALGQTGIINPGLASLDSALSVEGTDYVGTRLHAGVRSLQHKRRTLVISVDNRATEISKDTNLPVMERKEVVNLKSFISGEYEIKIKLPTNNIEIWRKSIQSAFSNFTGNTE